MVEAMEQGCIRGITIQNSDVKGVRPTKTGILAARLLYSFRQGGTCNVPTGVEGTRVFVSG